MLSPPANLVPMVRDLAGDDKVSSLHISPRVTFYGFATPFIIFEGT